MAFEVLRTLQVRHAVEREMDSTARASYDAARDDLRGRGCGAGGHRLVAVEGDDYPRCGRHLAYDWRMYTAYLDDERVVIVAVDRHTDDHDPVGGLAEALPGLATVGRRSKDKPPWCDDPLDPPVMNDELREMVDALRWGERHPRMPSRGPSSCAASRMGPPASWCANATAIRVGGRRCSWSPSSSSASS